MAVVGPLVLSGAMPSGVVGGDKMVFKDEETNSMPPTRSIGRVPNNLDSTFRNDLTPYLSKQHYLISINAIYTLRHNMLVKRF